jgi:hypothetical protein
VGFDSSRFPNALFGLRSYGQWMKSWRIIPPLGWLAAAGAVAEPSVGVAAPAPVVKPEAPAEAPTSLGMRQLTGTRYRLGAIEFDKATREISIPAKVNMVKGMLEYVIVHEGGKLHESLLSTTARAFDLNVVLLLLNYQPMPGWFEPGRSRSLEGVKLESRIDVVVRWQDGEGGEKSARLEKWVTDTFTGKPAPDGPWVYNGSGMNEENRFSAEVDGSIAALYLDNRSLLNSPLPGNADDERWEPTRGIPPKDTAVTVVLKPTTNSSSTAPSTK